MGKCSETCLSEDKDTHIGATESVFVIQVYGKFSFWLGYDFVASFV